MSKESVEKAIGRYKNLETSASQRDEWINKISHYAVPTLFNSKYDIGSTRSNLPSDVYDSAMVQASTIFASGLYSYLTNPATKWLTFSLRDKDALNIDGVRDWLQHVESRLYSVLADTNFYPQIHQAYRSLTFGNCILYRERDADKVVRYYSMPLTDCYFERDHTRRVVAMWRRVKRTPLELVTEFPETVSDKIKAMANDGACNKFIECLHVVRPRTHRDFKKFDKENKKFESLFIDMDNKTLLKTDGYDTFPYFVGYFIEDAASAYGYGPGHLALYDSKTLNQMVLTIIRSAQKQADPPLSIPSDGYILPFLQDPGAINYRLTSDPRDIPQPIMTGANVQPALQLILDAREAIRQSFFVDLFLSITNTTKRMTVPELQERIAERAPLLGPVVDNLTSGFLNELIDDLVNIMMEDGIIDAPPIELEGTKYMLEWLSPLAKAQRTSELNAIAQFGQVLATTMQMDPNSVDNVDFDELIRQASDVTGLNQKIIKEQGQVKKDRTRRLEAMAAQQQRAEAMEAAGAAEKATKADLNLSQIGGGGGAQ